MKNLLVITLSIFLSAALFAQNNAGKADDGDRISLTPQVSDQEIPQGAKKLLMNKMKQICAKNGLSGDGANPFFVMDASVDIMSKELTSTAPPMHALVMQVNFFIKDVVNNNIYSETSFEIKGVGTNETKAYVAGLKNINTSKGQFKAFVERGKTKILEFYNSECDYILAKAKALKEQGSNGEAIKVLKSVPKVSLECYDKCMEILATIEPPVEEMPSPSVNNSGASSEMSQPLTPVSGKEIEIEQGIFIVYQNGKQLGDKTQLFFQIQNRGSEDYEFKDYVYDTRCLDGNGAEFKVKDVVVAGNGGGSSYRDATVLPGVPVQMKCEFDKIKSISMFEYKYKGRVFRIKDIAIEPTAVSKKEISGEKSLGNVVAVKLGDKVYAEVSGYEEFKYHNYVPAKIKTMASTATKGEYEVLTMGSGSSKNNWTPRIVTKWHSAKKEEIKEGMVVLYDNYEIKETSDLHVGIVVDVSELYKNLVSIKGHYDDIDKVAITNVIIPDSPKVKAP